MTAPSSDAPSELSSTDSASNLIFDALGDELHERQQPEMAATLVAAGGFAIGVGLVGIGVARFDDGGSRGVLFGLSILALALAYAALAAWPWGDATDVRPGAIACLSVGIVGLVGAITEFDGISLPFVLIAVFFAVAWVAPYTRGRPLLLGVALFGLVAAILAQVGTSGTTIFDLGLSTINDIGAVALVLGVLMLGVMFILDKQGRHGALATPFAAVGNGTFLIGLVSVLVQVGSTAGIATLAFLGGIFLVASGVNGDHRRFTTWHGAIALFVGLAGWVATIYDGSNDWIAGLLFVALGAALVGGALFLYRRTTSTDSASSIDLSGDTAAPIAPTATADVAATHTTVMGATAPVETSATPAAWYPDPMGRHQERYWDGAEWTSTVRDDGAEGNDPI